MILVRLAAANISNAQDRLLYYGGCWLFIWNHCADYRINCQTSNAHSIGVLFCEKTDDENLRICFDRKHIMVKVKIIRGDHLTVIEAGQFFASFWHDDLKVKLRTGNLTLEEAREYTSFVSLVADELEERSKTDGNI